AVHPELIRAQEKLLEETAGQTGQERNGKLARRLKDLDDKYGEKNKISYIVVAGHGNKNSVRLGNGSVWKNNQFYYGDEDLMTIKDLQKKSAIKIKNYYTVNCPIAFLSCSTGVDDGIAVNYSSFFAGSLTIGPKFDSSDEEIHLLASPIDGRLRFEGRYKKIDKYEDGAYFWNSNNYSDQLLLVKSQEKNHNLNQILSDSDKMKECWEDPFLRSELIKYVLEDKLIDLVGKIKSDNILLDVVFLDNHSKGGIQFMLPEDILKRSNFNKKMHEPFMFKSFPYGFQADSAILEDISRWEYSAYSSRMTEPYRDIILVVGEKRNGKTVVLGGVNLDLRYLWPENIRRKIENNRKQEI
ncbi:MAG: hypothetical protein HQK53_20200, partial [Oligoflexia bacterium]|nr:hypothetical protein [Oligoflexia bacterium]